MNTNTTHAELDRETVNLLNQQCAELLEGYHKLVEEVRGIHAVMIDCIRQEMTEKNVMDEKEIETFLLAVTDRYATYEKFDYDGVEYDPNSDEVDEYDI